MKNQVFVAFYKHKVKIKSWRTFKNYLVGTLIRKATKSQYSHCELVFKSHRDDSFNCYSSSPRDGGVRKKIMQLDTAKWDLVEVDISPNRIKRTFKFYVGKKYDFLGAVGLFFGKQDNNKYFCSEYCAEVLKLNNSLISPQQLYDQLTS